LMRELGSLLDPIERLLFNDAEPNPSKAKVAVLAGQYAQDLEGDFLRKLEEFCTMHGSILQPYFANLRSPLYRVLDVLHEYRDDYIEATREGYGHLQSQIEAALLDVPADDLDVMLPPKSPFQTYLRLLAICGCTSTKLQLFDRYLDAE